MSKTRILIHLVFSTKNRYQTIPLLRKRDLYAYINGILNSEKCKTLRINGMSDHIHILFDLHPSIALANLVKKIKQSSSVWMGASPYFCLFEGWSHGYYAASIGPDEEAVCKEYIKNQEIHHGGKELVEEMKELSLTYHLDWDDRDWE